MPKATKKQRARDFVAAQGWNEIGEAEWRELRRALPDVSETTLRECGVPIQAPWSGLRTHTLDELEASLCEFSRVYEAREDLRRYCREQAIAAKDRTRWVAKYPKFEESRRRLKLEMLQWMLVWLDDPAMFPAWVSVRRNQSGQLEGAE